MDELQQWAAKLYAHTPDAPPDSCEWAAAGEGAVPVFNADVAQQGAKRAQKRAASVLGGSQAPATGKKARQASNRLPMYNLRQVMLWVEECDTKNQEHERAKICRLLIEVYMRLLPKLNRRPTSACNCNSCVAYKERVRGEALSLGWSITQSPDLTAPYCPHLGEDHLLQD